MARIAWSPDRRSALAAALVLAAGNRNAQELLWEVWELALLVGSTGTESPWTATLNPFEWAERVRDLEPGAISTGQLDELVYGHTRAPQDPLWRP
jgi:hypothetical protein